MIKVAGYCDQTQHSLIQEQQIIYGYKTNRISHLPQPLVSTGKEPYPGKNSDRGVEAGHEN
jgi:hypothetical protein